MRDKLKADKEELADWEEKTAAARNKGLFFKRLHKSSAKQGKMTGEASGGEEGDDAEEEGPLDLEDSEASLDRTWCLVLPLETSGLHFLQPLPTLTLPKTPAEIHHAMAGKHLAIHMVGIRLILIYFIHPAPFRPTALRRPSVGYWPLSRSLPPRRSIAPGASTSSSTSPPSPCWSLPKVSFYLTLYLIRLCAFQLPGTRSSGMFLAGSCPGPGSNGDLLASPCTDLLSDSPSFGSDALYAAITAALLWNIYSERRALQSNVEEKGDQGDPKP